MSLGTNDIDQLIKKLEPLLAQTTTAPDGLFTVQTLAEYLQVSVQWVYERVQLREIPFIRIGKFPRFRKADVDRWLDSLAVPASHPVSRALQQKRKAVDNNPSAHT